LKGLQPIQIAEQQHLRDLLASGLISDYSLAIDGGAHLGGWTRIMAEHFSTVIAVEPSEAFEQLRENCAGLPNVRLINAALMAGPGKAACYSKPNRALTSRKFAMAEDGPVDAITIDSLNLDRCGLIKLDIEGGEYAALVGAMRTLKRFRPFVLCEMAGLGEDDAVREFIEGRGYRQVFERGVDKGFRHEG
jgi:FkbM family methyltransferase